MDIVTRITCCGRVNLVVIKQQYGILSGLLSYKESYKKSYKKKLIDINKHCL